MSMTVSSQAGERISTRQDLYDLPLGSVIHSTSGVEFRKIQGQEWHDTAGRRGPRYSQTMTYGAYTVVSVPDTTLVGSRVETRTTYDALPVGTVLRGATTGRRYTIRDDRRLDREGAARARRIDEMRLSNLVIEAYPNGGEFAPPGVPSDVATETPFQIETLRQFKARFRRTVRQSALDNGYLEATEAACARLGCVAEPPTVGMRVNISRATDLPVGVVVATEAKSGPEMAVRGWNGQEWALLMGNPSVRSGLKVISGSVTAEDWASEQGTAEDVIAIAKFKQEAWKVGAAVKRAHSMCSVYEQTMAQAGITRETANAQAPAPLTAEQAAALPEGALLCVIQETSVNLYRRVDAADNPARTVRIGGSMTGHWARFMHPLWTPGERMSISADRYLLDAMPVGARLRYSGQQFTKASNGWSAENGYSGYSSRDLVSTETRVVMVP